jgi:Protein of unknown function (DUF2946)
VGSIFRFLACLTIASIVSATIPAQTPPSDPEQRDCCATMKAKSARHDCEHDSPRPEPDKQCCAFCSLGLAVIVSSAAPFVYPSVGDETFAAYLASEHQRSHRPPVPPPRA